MTRHYYIQRLARNEKNKSDVSDALGLSGHAEANRALDRPCGAELAIYRCTHARTHEHTHTRTFIFRSIYVYNARDKSAGRRLK